MNMNPLWLGWLNISWFSLYPYSPQSPKLYPNGNLDVLWGNFGNETRYPKALSKIKSWETTRELLSSPFQNIYLLLWKYQNVFPTPITFSNLMKRFICHCLLISICKIEGWPCSSRYPSYIYASYNPWHKQSNHNVCDYNSISLGCECYWIIKWFPSKFPIVESSLCVLIKCNVGHVILLLKPCLLFLQVYRCIDQRECTPLLQTQVSQEVLP